MIKKEPVQTYSTLNPVLQKWSFSNWLNQDSPPIGTFQTKNCLNIMNKEIRPSIRSSLKDSALIKAFQAGDSGVFDELVHRHKDSVFNLCYRFLGDHQEANDSAQEIFIKVYRSLKKFRFKSSFSTWLYRIAVNTCKNRIKSLEYRFKKRMKRLDNQEIAIHGNPSDDWVDESQSPMVALERKEQSRIIQEAINSLPETKRTMILLRDIEGLTYDEIADVTGLNLGTVKSKLARARSDLRDKLRDCE